MTLSLEAGVAIVKVADRSPRLPKLQRSSTWRPEAGACRLSTH